MPTPKVNSWLGWRIFTVNSPLSRARRVSRTGAGARRHGTDTGRAAQSLPTVMGMGSSLGSWCAGTGARAPGAWWRRPTGVRALNARVRGPTHTWGAPSSVADPGRGRGVPSSEAGPARGGVSPRARRSPLEGSAAPRTGRSPPEGSAYPRARRNMLEGVSKRAASMGRRSPCGVGCSLHG
jgi:hypothetical protein